MKTNPLWENWWYVKLVPRLSRAMLQGEILIEKGEILIEKGGILS